jgi:Ser/Thr protein kinase RdoA (MazF antagonist)
LSNTRLALVFDDLPGAVRVSKLPATRGLCGAAAWIGRFHASHALHAKNEAAIPLLRYHLDYYLGWADRTRRFAALEGPEPHWLAGLCRSFARVAQLLVDGSLTVIHGEYYPDNVLVRETVVHPVDWQTAAVAAGEIDLAALTERWPRAVAEQCERAYRSARWADETPASFHDTLLAARLYLHFRWLGDRPEWTRAERFRSHWVALRSIAAQLDALAPSTGGD